MSAIGEHGLVWVTIAVLMLFSKRLRKWGVALIVTMLVSWLLGEHVVKVLVARPRPFYVDPTLALIVDPPSGYSMPSGHTLVAFCAATLLLFSPLGKGGKASAFAVAVLIAFSRLYLCVHNPTDVIAGALFGAAFGVLGGRLCACWTLEPGAAVRGLLRRDVSGEHVELSTIWGERVERACAPGSPSDASAPLPEHPDPQFARADYRVLNGWWDYAFVEVGSAREASNAWRDADAPDAFEGKILVPFSPEAPLSGVRRQLRPDELLWYRTEFDSHDLPHGERCLLHFEAVDYECACYVNGSKAALHVGGYEPFSVDITEALVEGANEIALCVHDASEQGPQLRGAQRLAAEGRWHTAQSGIWGSVWLEGVPETRILGMRLEASLEAESLVVVPELNDWGGRLELELREADGTLAARQSVLASADRPSAPELRVHVPHPHAWSPEDPYLYGLVVSYGSDRVQSYCAFRDVEIVRGEDGASRFCLNGSPRFLRGVLDEGSWPDGLMTAPSDDALAFDVQSAKNLGFDAVRLLVKVESMRFYYHCDRLGLLVWQDMVSGGEDPGAWQSQVKPALWRSSWGRYDDATPSHCAHLGAGDEVYRKRWREACLATVRRLANHPCICTWSLFNEGWGQFGARAAVSMVRAADPSRPVNATSGWYDQACGDYLGVIPRYREPEVYRDRRGRDGELSGVASPAAHDIRLGRAFVFSDVGGLSLHVEGHSASARPVSRGDAEDASAWRAQLRQLLERLEGLEAKGASGFFFARLSDVAGEEDGIFTYDRRVNKLETGARDVAQSAETGKDAL